MYLIDTNIFLELLLEQEKSQNVQAFFQKVNQSKLFITDFSLHSIGIILFKLKKSQVFAQFVSDILQAGMQVIRMDPEDVQILIKSAQHFNLDFDDAYQYGIAEKFNLKIVSLDSDFDRTARGRETL